MKKAINDIKPGLRFSCHAHDINLVIKNALNLFDKPKKKKYVVFPEKWKTDVFAVYLWNNREIELLTDNYTI